MNYRNIIATFAVIMMVVFTLQGALAYSYYYNSGYSNSYKSGTYYTSYYNHGSYKPMTGGLNTYKTPYYKSSYYHNGKSTYYPKYSYPSNSYSYSTSAGKVPHVYTYKQTHVNYPKRVHGPSVITVEHQVQPIKKKYIYPSSVHTTTAKFNNNYEYNSYYFY